MKLMRSTRLIAAAFALVAMSATHAAAQAPVLNVSANGATVTIEWTDLQSQGAVGYNLEVGGSLTASVNLPATVTRIVVAAPAGTYSLRVRGLAASGAFGPYSNVASVTVGSAGPGPSPTPGPCSAPSAPSVTVNVSGLSVVVNWGAAAGATSYRVEFGFNQGGTDFVQNVGAATSFSQYVGMAGTFHVRVVASNACGSTSSQSHSFTLGNSTPNTPGGARTPDPAPGTLIPRATLAYLRTVVENMAVQYRGDLLNSCATHTWVYRVVHALRQIDTRWGLNYKRGWNGDMSHDVVAYNPTAGPDEGASQIYLFDIIANHCPISGSPGPNWQDVTDPTWAGRGDPACAPGTWCARWTLVPYLRAGFPADPRQ
jgi:hypothetical protein